MKGQISRGDVIYVDLGYNRGSEQSGTRPCVVVQNDIGNKYSPTLIVLPITDLVHKGGKKKKLPTHVYVAAGEGGTKKDSVVMAEQIKVIDGSRLKDRIGFFSKNTMDRIDKALVVSIGLENFLSK